MVDKINPGHYRGHGEGSPEAIDVIEAFELNFSRGNTIKYILRAGNKGERGYSSVAKELEDLNKAKWYLEREISRIIDLESEGRYVDDE